MLTIGKETKNCLLNVTQGGWSRDELIKEAKRKGKDIPSNITKPQLCELLTKGSEKKVVSPVLKKSLSPRKSPKKSENCEKLYSVTESVVDQIYDKQIELLSELKGNINDFEIAESKIIKLVNESNNINEKVDKLTKEITKENKKTFKDKGKIADYFGDIVILRGEQVKIHNKIAEISKEFGELKGKNIVLSQFHKFIAGVSREIYEKIKI